MWGDTMMYTARKTWAGNTQVETNVTSQLMVHLFVLKQAVEMQ